MADCAEELTWVQSLLFELKVFIAHAPILWCYNIGAMYLSVNLIFHARTKHVEIDYHFVREKVARKDLQIKFVQTNDQLADILMKLLSSARHEFLKRKLNAWGIQPLACRGITDHKSKPVN